MSTRTGSDNRKEPFTKRRLESAISHGKYILADTDHRSPAMKRLKDLLAQHLSDIPDASHAEKALIGRASMLILLSELREAEFARHEFKRIKGDDLTAYLRGVNSLKRVLEVLGLQRRMKDVPTVEEWKAQKLREKENQLADEAAE